MQSAARGLASEGERGAEMPLAGSRIYRVLDSREAERGRDTNVLDQARKRLDPG